MRGREPDRKDQVLNPRSSFGPSLTRFMQTALGNIVSNWINVHKTGAFRRQSMI